MAYKIIKGIAYIITLYTITSLIYIEQKNFVPTELFCFNSDLVSSLN